MVDEKDYELVPHKEVLELRRELDRLKMGKPSGRKGKASLQSSIEELSSTIHTLMDLFKEAGEGMKDEEIGASAVGKSLKPMVDRMNNITEQNEKIAEGIVAIADMMADFKTRVDRLDKDVEAKLLEDAPKAPLLEEIPEHEEKPPMPHGMPPPGPPPFRPGPMPPPPTGGPPMPGGMPPPPPPPRRR